MQSEHEVIEKREEGKDNAETQSARRNAEKRWRKEKRAEHKDIAGTENRERGKKLSEGAGR
jgi:hypothetical protein